MSEHVMEAVEVVLADCAWGECEHEEDRCPTWERDACLGCSYDPEDGDPGWYAPWAESEAAGHPGYEEMRARPTGESLDRPKFVPDPDEVPRDVQEHQDAALLDVDAEVP